VHINADIAELVAHRGGTEENGTFREGVAASLAVWQI